MWPEALTLLLVTCPHSIYVHTPLLYYPPSAAHCSNCSICPNGKMDLSELQNLFVHIWLHIWGGPLYYLSNAAHCSCCYLVCLWLTALLARGGHWLQASLLEAPSIWRTHPRATLPLLIQQSTSRSVCLSIILSPFLPRAIVTSYTSYQEGS